MKLHVHRFMGLNELDVEFVGLTLLTGASGAGKSSIFEAISWCLFGKCSAKNDVELAFTDWGRIRRNAFLTSCLHGQELGHDQTTQAIAKVFGPQLVWQASSYCAQGSRTALLTGTGSEKFEILEHLALGDTDLPDAYLQRLDSELAQVRMHTAQLMAQLGKVRESMNCIQTTSRLDVSILAGRTRDQIELELSQVTSNIRLLEREIVVAQVSDELVADDGRSICLPELERKVNAATSSQYAAQRLNSLPTLPGTPPPMDLAKNLSWYSSAAQAVGLEVIDRNLPTLAFLEQAMRKQLDASLASEAQAKAYEKYVECQRVRLRVLAEREKAKHHNAEQARLRGLLRTKLDFAELSQRMRASKPMECPNCSSQLSLLDFALVPARPQSCLLDEAFDFELWKRILPPLVEPDLPEQLDVVLEPKPQPSSQLIAKLIAEKPSLEHAQLLEHAAYTSSLAERKKLESMIVDIDLGRAQAELAEAKQILNKRKQTGRPIAIVQNELTRASRLQANLNRAKSASVRLAALDESKNIEMQLSRELAAHEAKQSSIIRITQLVRQVSSSCLEAFVSDFNQHLAEIISKLFDETIHLALKTSRTLKTRQCEKLEVNLAIKYRNVDSVKQLSGGEQDRVSLALMIALSRLHYSPCLLLDECMSSLPGPSKQKCISALRRVTDRTIVHVCHEILPGLHDAEVSIP